MYAVLMQTFIQSNMLYTFDPKAMHHIVIKDQDIFEEPTWFTR